MSRWFTIIKSLAPARFKIVPQLLESLFMHPKRTILFGLAIPFLFATVFSMSAEAKKPNLIFVLSDDIAQGDLGCYGQQLIQTPRLDQMAAEGTRYMQGYCGTSVCAPSRSSFFTGLHTGHCPVRGNYELPPEGQLPLPAETVTIAEVAKAAGYATSTFGKWGMGFFDTTGSPMKQGIDRFFGYNCQRHAH
ncbi:MAG: sulfatase-like hydrolase/transferase, partial [Rubripirellula sp.]